MATCISYKDQFVWVSNRRFSALIDFTIELGGRIAKTDEERAIVGKLRTASDAFYPGYDFHLDTEFTSLAERNPCVT